MPLECDQKRHGVKYFFAPNYKKNLFCNCCCCYFGYYTEQIKSFGPYLQLPPSPVEVGNLRVGFGHPVAAFKSILEKIRHPVECLIRVIFCTKRRRVVILEAELF